MENIIKFNCKNCNIKIKIQLKYAGKKGKCPNCKASCIVPKTEPEYEIVDIDGDMKELEKKWESFK